MKNRNGAISVYTLLACLFFLIFIMAAYRNISSKSRTQIETTGELVEMYKSDTSSSALYEGIVTNESAENKTKTEKQEETVTDENNKGSYIALNGKIYNIE